MPENSRAYKFPHRTHNVCSCVNIAQRASHGLLDLNKPTAHGPAARASTNESSQLECTKPLRLWNFWQWEVQASPRLATAVGDSGQPEQQRPSPLEHGPRQPWPSSVRQSACGINRVSVSSITRLLNNVSSKQAQPNEPAP